MVKKFADVQLQDLPLPHMGACVGPGASAKPVCGGVGGDFLPHQQVPENTALDCLEKRIRNQESACLPIRLGDFSPVIVAFDMVAEAVQRFPGKPQIRRQGGKLSVYDHPKLPPFLRCVEQNHGNWEAVQLYGRPPRWARQRHCTAEQLSRNTVNL